ncbi:MAG: hypothetical protein M0R46_16380 [Candidatus Muirbacterium halophilum]|nr:hypothetical protein [Candidatus Muirbacterium halophilum]
MIYLRLFEDFKNNNVEGSLINREDIISTIKANGYIYSDIVKDLVISGDVPLRVIDIDDDSLITIEFEGKLYNVDIKNVTKLEY